METELATFIRELVEKNRSFVCTPDTLAIEVYSVETYKLQSREVEAIHFFTMDGNRIEV